MVQNLNKVEKAYDSLAKEWVKSFSGEHDYKLADQQILYRFSQEIKDRVPVWDFGCGPGNTSEYLHNLGVEISGLDLSENMLEQARIYHPTISFKKGDILDLKFENDSIAGIVAFYAIVHFTDQQVLRAFHEVFRVLQPGGIFLFTYHVGEDTIHLNEFLGKTIDIDFMFFTTDFILNSLQKCGFEKIDLIKREPYSNIEHQSQRAYVFASKPLAPYNQS